MQKISVVEPDGHAVGILEEANSAALTVRLPDGQHALVSREDLEPLADGTVLLKTPVSGLRLMAEDEHAAVVSAATLAVADAGVRPLGQRDAESAPAGHTVGDVTTIPRVEEQLDVQKVERELGRLRVHVRTSEKQQTVAVPLTDERADVRRVEVGRMVDEVPAVREDGDTVIIPVVEEVLVIQKRLLLREEIHIVRSKVTRTEEHQVSLRSEHVEITRSGKS